MRLQILAMVQLCSLLLIPILISTSIATCRRCLDLFMHVIHMLNNNRWCEVSRSDELVPYLELWCCNAGYAPRKTHKTHKYSVWKCSSIWLGWLTWYGSFPLPRLNMHAAHVTRWIKVSFNTMKLWLFVFFFYDEI